MPRAAAKTTGRKGKATGERSAAAGEASAAVAAAAPMVTAARRPSAAATATATKAKATRGPSAAAGEPSAAAATATKVKAAWQPAAPGLWFCNWNIWLEARRRLDRALAPLDLHSREFWLLAIAGRGNVSQHEIADLCGLDPSSLVAVFDGLERRGWLRRQRNPRDRRIQWVQRTEAGDRLFHQALPRAQRAEAQQLAVLSAAQQRQLVAAMRKLVMISK